MGRERGVVLYLRSAGQLAQYGLEIIPKCLIRMRLIQRMSETNKQTKNKSFDSCTDWAALLSCGGVGQLDTPRGTTGSVVLSSITRLFDKYSSLGSTGSPQGQLLTRRCNAKNLPRLSLKSCLSLSLPLPVSLPVLTSLRRFFRLPHMATSLTYRNVLFVSKTKPAAVFVLLFPQPLGRNLFPLY